MTSPVLWQPSPGPQTRFLALSSYEVTYGGSAGSGKSSALLMGALRYVSEPSYRALLLRRTFPELEKSLIDKSHTLFPLAFPDARYHEQKKCWTFPSGARLYFGHLERDADVFAYQSAEFQYLGFDELTSFSERQYVYLLSRARSSTGIPVRIRAATNPGGEGHDWVFARWAPWLDRSPSYAGPRAQAGEVLWYRNGDHGAEYVEPLTPGALSRAFVPAVITDNPHLMQADPGYIDRLRGLDPLTRAQLLDGDWLARAARGILFKRAWFPHLDIAPAKAMRIRYWDRAASEDGDWTVGLRLARADGQFVIEDVIRFRGRPHEVERTIRATAEADGQGVTIGIEQDPGQAGKFEADYYVKTLAGFPVRTFRVSHDKVTRAQPASSQAEAGNLKLLRGSWNAVFVQELEEFPESKHDDQVDALSGAFAALTTGRAPSLDPRFYAYAPRSRM